MKINATALTREEFFFKALKIISLLAPEGKELSDPEASILVKFMTQAPKYSYYPFSAHARKDAIARHSSNMTKQALSQKITSLISKGYLYRDEDRFINYNKVIKQLIDQYSKDVQITVNLSCRAPD